MAMRHVEIELRRTGNPEDLKCADTIAEMLKSRGVDITLPIAETAILVDVGLGVDYLDICNGGSVVLVAPRVVSASPKL